MSVTRAVNAKAGFDRALAAEPRLEPIVRLVGALCALAGPEHAMCSGCVWTGIVKPLVTPLVGWGRGYHDEEEKDPEPGESRWRPLPSQPGHVGLVAPAKLTVNLAELMAETDQQSRAPCTTDTERWLRSSEAFNAFTDVLLDRLNEADPANGCGIGRVGL